MPAARKTKTFPSVSKSKKTADTLAAIEKQIRTLSRQNVTPQMRRKIRSLQKVHDDLKTAYKQYMKTAMKKNVDVMFTRVMKTLKRRPARRT